MVVRPRDTPKKHFRANFLQQGSLVRVYGWVRGLSWRLPEVALPLSWPDWSLLLGWMQVVVRTRLLASIIRPRECS